MMMGARQKQIEEQIFRLLDPTLRLLLACNEQLASAVSFPYENEDEQQAKGQGQGGSVVRGDTDSSHNRNNGRICKTNREEVLLTLYKTQSSLFQRLQNDMSSLFVDAEIDEAEIYFKQKTLHDMEEYITLPIILCLQQEQDNSNWENSGLVNNSENNSVIIRNSAHRKSVEKASSCLTTYIHHLQQHGNALNNTCKEYRDTRPPTFTIKHISVNLRVKCIVALTVSLTSIIESKQKARSRLNLDKGDECIQELLVCLRLLILPPTTVTVIEHHNHDEEEIKFVLDFFNFIPNGGLIVGIVQNCIKCFDNEDSNSSNESEDGSQTNNNAGDIRGNVGLKLHALGVLEALLGVSCGSINNCHYLTINNKKGCNIGGDVEQWKAEDPIVICFRLIFPTCFGVLFRQLHAHLRFATSFSSSKLAMRYMNVLSLLMQKTLCQRNEQDEQSQGKAMDSHTKMNHIVEESTKSLMIAASHLQANARESITRMQVKNKTGDIGVNTKEYEKFVHNVKQRIPFPLTILCHLIPTHASTKVRKAGVQFLCKCILVDTYMVWRGEEYDGLDSLRQSAFACLMIMLDDKNNQVSELCMEVFNLYQTKEREYVQNSKTDNYDMMSCVLEIIQGLPSIARSRRESDLKMKMKLISGYISVICRMIPSKQGGGKNTHHDFLCRKIMNNPYKQCLADVFCLEDNCENNSVVSVESSNSQKFKYLQEDTAIIARGMIHKISQLLGPKNCAIFADGCIADIFDSILERSQNKKLSVCDKTHFRWTQNIYGIVIITAELMKGQEQMGLNKRHAKIFKSFSKSVLPILFSDPLWQLPTTFQWAQPMKGKIQKNTKSIQGSVFGYSQRHLIPTSKISDTPFEKKENPFISDISAAALNGNGLLQINFMQIIETLSSILGTSFAEYIPTILYPLLQKTSDINSAIVQKASLDTLKSISLSSGYKSLDEMLSTYFRYIIEVFSLELQAPFVLKSEDQLRQQAVCFYSLHAIVRFILTNAIKENGPRRSEDCTHICDDRFMALIDIIQTINDWFNKNFKKNLEDLVQLMVVPLGMVQVFKGCTEYIDSLLQFYMKIHSNTDKVEKLILPSNILSRLIDTIKQMMLTNSMFLSIPDLKLQRESCDLFGNCFHLLSTIQSYTKNIENSALDLGNPLFETASKYWFPLQSRFQATAQSLLRIDNNDDTALIHSGYLLSSLLNIISILSELCDGFISDRFQNTIFPHMSKLLDFLLGKILDTNSGNTIARNSLLRKEDDITLNALLDCTCRVFLANGSHLSTMVPIVGSIILPFVGLNGASGLSAMEAMKALVRVDSDCLWRALLQASGTPIPARPLLPLSLQSQTMHSNPKSFLSTRCLEIINFVYELPEQDIQ